MRVVAAILAAGSSTRLGADKTLEKLNGKAVWQWSFDTYCPHPGVDEVLVVASESNYEPISQKANTVIRGGKSRQESAWNALKAAGEADIILFHDAARPFVSPKSITDVIEAVPFTGSAGLAVPVKDTIRCDDGNLRCLDRARLHAMQTPQGGLVSLFLQAYSLPWTEVTDDLAMLETIGVTPTLVPGEEGNFKITTQADLEAARLRTERTLPRVGTGYDVHAFSNDPDRTLMLGGLAFPGARPLDGHSDADVLLHAIVDALLGAAALGDIGQHFQNTDKRWKDAPSRNFLRAAGEMVRENGWIIINIDATVVAEEPKIMGFAGQIRATIAGELGIDVNQVSVKATTNERLGFVGRGEGIAAIATATIA